MIILCLFSEVGFSKEISNNWVMIKILTLFNETSFQHLPQSMTQVGVLGGLSRYYNMLYNTL